MDRFRRKIFLVGLFGALLICTSWGFLVHRTVNQLAIYELRGDLREFFMKHMDYMVKNAPRPDQRRNRDSTEASKHFIDLEIFGDSSAWKMPMKWEDAVRKFGKDSLLEYGYLPYLVLKIKDSLTTAFRQKNPDSVLFYAADLGHYIGDAHVPLHTSMNYDGQLTNQKGLHSLWESTIPEIELNAYDLSSRHKATYLAHPDQQIWKAIRESYQLLPELFLQEKEVSKRFTAATKFRTQVRRGVEVKSYSSEFAKAYSESLGASINRQLTRSTDMIADFIYTSWLDAGKPSLDISYSKKEKKAEKKELKAFRKNKLLKDSLLLARKPDLKE